MLRPIYLDHNATTPVAAEVLSAMLPYLERHFGNPSSDHAYAPPARHAIQLARAQVARLLGCDSESIVFTAGGSEADNLAIKGATADRRREGAHIITTAIEHPAVLNTCQYLEQHLGYRLTILGVDRSGLVDPDDVRRSIEPSTVMVSVMHANNEIGTLQPIAEIAAVARDRGIVFHTDAAQSVGKVSTAVDELGVDLLAVAGHKLYAPKGIGALYVRPGTRIDPLIHGADHERGLRAGTENVPYIVALGAACALARERLLAGADARIGRLRDRLHTNLEESVPGLALNGHRDRRLPNTLNVSFPGLDGEQLLARTPAVAASTGAACHSGRTEPSPVLTAMGLNRARALGAVRLSLGYDSTEADVDAAAGALTATVTAAAADS